MFSEILQESTVKSSKIYRLIGAAEEREMKNMPDKLAKCVYGERETKSRRTIAPAEGKGGEQDRGKAGGNERGG